MCILRLLVLARALWIGIALVPGEQGLNDSSDSSDTTTNTVFIDDDRTLLDAFGDAAKEFLTTKVIPASDSECDWDWRSVRCEPHCQCGWLPRRGDFHLGRACRLVATDDRCTIPDSNAAQRMVQKTLHEMELVVRGTKQSAQRGYRRIQISVCSGIPTQCTSDGTVPVLAWQERFFCRHLIPNCQSEETRATNTTSEEEDSPQ